MFSFSREQHRRQGRQAPSGAFQNTWREVALFGLALGVLLALLQLAEIRLLIVDRRVGIYSALVALLFAGVGIWLGLAWRGRAERRQATEAASAVAPFIPDEEAARALGVTPRELEILAAIALGLSNREIAERLFVSENTVKTHASRVFDKLGAKRRTEAVRLGRTQGLVR